MDVVELVLLECQQTPVTRLRGYHAIYFVLLLAALGSASNGEDTRKDDVLLRRGVRIHYRDEIVDIPRVTDSLEPSSVGVGLGTSRDPIVVTAVGSPVGRKEVRYPNPEDHSGNCVLFVNVKTGTHERVSYPQPPPGRIVVSPDGKLAALVNHAGWAVNQRNCGFGPISQKAVGVTHRSSSEIASRLKERAVGTMRYSIWEVSPARPLWKMRFYDHSAKDGAAARFYRPWDEADHLVLPWWAIDSEPIVTKLCQVAFSSDSKFFVALDPEHGIHVLRISDGMQLHLDTTKDGPAPFAFAFVRLENRIQVIFENAKILEFDLATGDRLTPAVSAIPPDCSLSVLSKHYVNANFVLDSRTGMFGLIKPGSLELLSNGAGDGYKPWKRIRGIENSHGLCRLDMAPEMSYLGLGFGSVKNGLDTQDLHWLSKYEVANLDTGHVVRRIIRSEDGRELDAGSDSRTFTDSMGVVVTTVKSNICACLTADGQDVAFVLPLQK